MSLPASSADFAAEEGRVLVPVAASPVARRDGMGAVFTRAWAVDMVLDVAGYTVDRDLAAVRAVEPACGTGAFLTRMVARLLDSCDARGRSVLDARNAIRAYDLDPDSVVTSRRRVRELLRERGVGTAEGAALSRRWVAQGDFLVPGPRPDSADLVVGNPPYVRVEDVPEERMTAYRDAWPDMAGRADVYVGFLSAGLAALRPEGKLAYICADRWMRNQYGARVRGRVEAGYAVDAAILLHHVDAFEEPVAAYPAVVVLRRGEQGPALVAEADAGFGGRDAAELTATARRGPGPVPVGERFRASWSPSWFRDTPSWPAGSPERLRLLADLEASLPSLAEAGVTVGIGVATGADAVLVTKDAGVVEPDRLLPLAMARDTTTGEVRWSGHWLVNMWDDDGRLVDLARHPRLAAYLDLHAAELKARHVALRRPQTWWRTIDNVRPGLAARPKILLPDLKDSVHPVLDPGGYYPHHNLYYALSDTWDLEVLGGLLLSEVAGMFVEAYSVRMANGFMRVSAQYLRRVRLPMLSTVGDEDAHALREAFRSKDRARATRVANRLYGLSGPFPS